MKKKAFVRCRGGSPASEGGPVCSYGCIGCGACAEVCRLHAVTLPAGGPAEISETLCVGCGMCVKACPQHIIDLVSASANIRIKCSSCDSPKASRTVCINSCIGCGICERSCPAGAVTVTDNRAVIDGSKCICCGMCAIKCPRGAIRDTFGLMTD